MNETTATLQKVLNPKNGNGDNGNKAKTNNGNNKPNNGAEELPPDRAKAVEYGLAQFQQIGYERDQMRQENIELRDKCAGLQIVTEGLTSQLTEAHSQIRSAMLVRDQAMADRIKYEALFVSIQAQLRAFAVPSAPLIKDHDEASD